MSALSGVPGAVDRGGSLRVSGLTVSFAAGRGRSLRAVEDVNFEVVPGESLGLVGESGCGKTTVARCCAGMQEPDAGSIVLDGVELGARRTREQRRAVQLVFQDPYSSLNPRMTVGAVLRELLATHDLARGPAASTRAGELLALVGLPRDALDRQPGAFSGGQRQRLAIARALAVEPRVLVADEPISALDVSVQATILSLFAELRSRLGVSLVMISHNLAAVRYVCDRVAVMYLGRIVEIGPTEAVFADPRHPYTRALLSAVPPVRPGRAVTRIHLKGEPPSPVSRPTGCAFHPRCPRAVERCSVQRPDLAPPDGLERLVECHFRDEVASATPEA